ncbi:predicted protein [Plenodomus lingam JN3]|uniref:Predicted protein n=1 Tax=Leptosphaeria maculans (strain JN3 / isolate v23.1.3 / race Av1-4-5-6-7-8) TaxID=985895 RepID=E4ZR09_LEPMJ|nr:predicted protein [Plenodomus lingam JN3]CBX93674.1 predicted protein [Plenodomus lingam JN3]
MIYNSTRFRLLALTARSDGLSSNIPPLAKVQGCMSPRAPNHQASLFIAGLHGKALQETKFKGKSCHSNMD